MSLSKDLVFLILQFCDEENLKKTAHMLEQETGYFFDLKYFEELVVDGSWEEAEQYLSSFTAVEDNKYSSKIYFEIRKQKYLEALHKHEFSTALDVLHKDLKVFAQSNKELYKEMAQLLALDDLRENDSVALYGGGDTLSARKRVVGELGGFIKANPLLQGRSRFPQINKSRLRRLVNQSLNWQHIHCTHPHPQPHIDTLFTDHKCPGPDSMQDQLRKDGSLLPTAVALSASPLSSKSTSDQSSVTNPLITATTVNLGDLSEEVLGNGKCCHDDSDANSTERTDEEELVKDTSARCQVSENVLPVDIPRKVEQILNTGSSSTTMDFHPVHEALLLVGKSSGEVEIWDVAAAEKVFRREFMGKVACNQDKLEQNHRISVNRVLWSPDGSLFGIAYPERLLCLYTKNGNYFEKKWEIEAHDGSVNDVAFSKPYNELFVISCGDDKLIQVWDAATGAKQYTFEGHRAPVYSICPNVKENVHFVYSVSVSGEIKAWLFDNKGSRVTYGAPGLCCMRMAFGAKSERRLFSCGTNKNGKSYIVEWNEKKGYILRNYHGLSTCSSAMVQFDTCINQFLAAGDEHLIKFWDIDNHEILAAIDAGGGLPATPHIRLSKKGSLLAVSADDNKIKILANEHGRQLLQESSFVPGDSSGFLTESFRKEEIIVDAMGNSNTKGPAEATNCQIVEVSRCQSVLLTSEVKTNVIRRLLYTHAGNGILALAEDGTHLLWRWATATATATTKCAPQLWQPKRGLLMINDLPEKSSGDVVVTPCLALSKNDSYSVSASGRMVSLYNIMVFKKLRNVMLPPPAATCLVFYPPDNNIIAIGMDDSTILIYNIRVDELISKLEGHSKRISGLAFSTGLKVLVSCGVDTQIVLWDSIKWEKKKSTVLQISVGWLASDLSETTIQLDKDQNHFLAVHETQLAIYETTTLRRVKQWTIANFCTRISHATYSCDSQLVYAAMRDGGILLILGASDLVPHFEIDPSAYLPSHLSCYVDPVVVAAHPQKPYQFALGLSNGGVVVIEPHESQGKWATKNQRYY